MAVHAPPPGFYHTSRRHPRRTSAYRASTHAPSMPLRRPQYTHRTAQHGLRSCTEVPGEPGFESWTDPCQGQAVETSTHTSRRPRVLHANVAMRDCISAHAEGIRRRARRETGAASYAATRRPPPACWRLKAIARPCHPRRRASTVKRPAARSSSIIRFRIHHLTSSGCISPFGNRRMQTVAGAGGTSTRNSSPATAPRG